MNTIYVSCQFNMAAKNSKWWPKLNKLNKMKEKMQCKILMDYYRLEHVYRSE